MTYGLADVVLHQSWIDSSGAPQEQKRIETIKLDALLGYCEAARCRRMVLLEYFGEQSTPCGNCDTCMSPPQMWDATIAAQKFLSAVLRTGQRFGAGHVIDVLAGRATDRVVQLGHDQLPTFGVGADIDDRGWRGIARQLVAQGLLRPDAQAYGALQVTQAAWPVLRSQGRLELRKAADPAPRASRAARSQPDARATRGAGRPVAGDLDPAAAGLFDSLRAERKRIADEQGVPAYVVCHDSTLKAIAQRRPRDTAELLGVPGIGAAKSARYGERFLAVISAADIEGG
jgi:ATP-dependent DNA helicase RecQ